MPIDASKVKWDDDTPDPAKVTWDSPEGVAGNGGAVPAPAIPENTLGQEAKRQGGIFLRAALNAAASPAVLLDKVQAKASDAITGKHIGGTLGEDLNARLTGLGLPEAERPVERFTQGMAESAPAFALPTTLPAQVLGNAAIAAAQSKPGEEGTQAAIGGAAGAAVPVLGGALKLAGKGAAHVLGATTGAGAEPVRQAFRNAPGFVENMRGGADPSAVVDSARQGVHTMRQQMYDAYAKSKGGWAGDTTPLNFQPIGQAYNEAVAKFSFKGTPQPGVEGVKAQTEQVLNNWLQKAQQDPSFLTVEGLDALKRHLSTITPADVTNRAGRAFVSEVVDAVKASVVRQRPDYAAAMKDYWQRSAQLDEIERSLSLGDKATVDTALRKLQSLIRNNVNTNFGQRVQSAHAIEDMGGANILPQVAGQALNSWTPRGLQGAVGIGGSIVNPSAIPMLPTMSPRLVGESARGVGMVANDPTTQALIEALRRFTPSATRKASNE
jgi:hypothetical protein